MRPRIHRAIWLPGVFVALSTVSAIYTGTTLALDRTQTVPQQSAAEPQYTIRTRVPITFLDVVVTDANGQFVRGLKQSDFTILEDKKEMTPNSFEEHRSDQASAVIPVKQTLPPNTFTNVDPMPSDRPINILLLDELNISASQQLEIQSQMLEMVGRMPPGTRMAVLRLTSYLTILQGITTDRDLIRAAIASKKAVLGDHLLQDGGSPADALANPAVPPASSPNADAQNNRPTASHDIAAEHMELRGEYTFVAMKNIARYLAGMPGHKNLIWFTGSLPAMWPPAGDPLDPYPGRVYNFTDDFISETDLLARAHVTIFPVGGARCIGFSPRCLEGETMDLMADQTGGMRVTGGNMANGVLKAIDSGSNFYALTYTPTNQAIDSNRFRNITVKIVGQPGLHLVYRSGYYAGNPDKSLSGMKLTHATAMQAAMLRGGLEPTQILFKVKAAPAAALDAALTAGSQPNPKKMKPPYRHYAITYSITIDNIQFSHSPDGSYRADFELGAMVYNADGDLVNTVSKEVRPVLSAAAWQSMQRTGATAHQQIDVPAKGDFFLRIGVHDLATDRVGALEIPTSSIKPEPAPALASAP